MKQKYDHKILTDRPESPCVRNCCLNDDDICVGCYRTLEEIKNWQASSDQQKRQVLESCQQRRQQKRGQDL